MLIRADARQIPLVDGCVQCCVTSPPYWGLRNYGTPGQIGLEPTPDAYVQTMVQVFREVWRVLRDDGTLWLNLGDSYSAGGGSASQQLDKLGERFSGGGHKHSSRPCGRAPSAGLAHKQLVGIPWRVAFALQADGWYLRSDIIWSKPNPMPESVTDRPTKSHEYLFLMAKQERYYYDAAAIAEKFVDERMGCPGGGNRNYAPLDRNDGSDSRMLQWSGVDRVGRNKRSVWTVATQPYAEAHFATFPPALIDPCILAGSRPGDLVLDPFIGSGTTGQVAERFMRRWVGCDLAYQHLSKTRTAQRGLRFIDEATA